MAEGDEGRTGAEVLAQTLIVEGVERVFGVPGTQNVPTFEAFRSAGVPVVLCTHELGACFMAGGHARAKGAVGVLATIPGPGFTYALPGLAEARLDSVPLLHVVGQPPSGIGGRFLHQAIPQESMVRDLVKDVVSVDHPGEMREAVVRALETARAGDPGPVVLHVARAAQNGRVGATETDPSLGERRPSVSSGDADAGMRALAQRLRHARRPVLFLGRGAGSGATHVRELVDRLGLAFFSTPSGRGVVDERHPLCLGFDPDRGGLKVLAEVLDEADMILALGCRMSYNGTAAFGLDLPAAKLAHVNTDHDALTGLRPADLSIQASVEMVVPWLLERLPTDMEPRWTHEEVGRWRSRLVWDGERGPPEPVFSGVPGGRPEAFFQAVRAALPEDAIVVADSGLHQVMTRRHLVVTAPEGLMLPADFQSMGFAVPTAIGAAIAAPSRPVLAVVGDGGFTMSGMEMLTAAREGVALVVVVVNDGFLNLIRLQQMQDDGVTHSVDLTNPNFRTLAEALGVGYALIDGDPEDTLRWAMAQSGPVLVELVAGDSSDILRARALGASKRVARAVAGPSFRSRLKRLLRLD